MSSVPSSAVDFIITPTDYFNSVWHLNLQTSRTRRKHERKPAEYYYPISEPARGEDLEGYHIYDFPWADEDNKNKEDDEGFALFVLSEVLFGFIGFYLGAAVRNHDEWNFYRWDWGSEKTSTAATRGGMIGGTTPYAFFYSAQVIGIEETIALAIMGTYLGMSSENKDWEPANWNWTSPKTYNGGLLGLQDCLWLTDDLAQIQVFTEKARMNEWKKAAFILISYTIGGIMAFHNIAHDNGGNYQFWEWDYKSPVSVYDLVKGFRMGTRLPVGFGEIGLEALEAIERSEDKRDRNRAFFYNFVIRNRWMWTGAVWLGLVYVSVENESFDVRKWNLPFLENLEAFLNGFIFGKDFQEIFTDVRKYFLGNGGDRYHFVME